MFTLKYVAVLLQPLSLSCIVSIVISLTSWWTQVAAILLLEQLLIPSCIDTTIVPCEYQLMILIKT